jgi:hypothetical protein
VGVGYLGRQSFPSLRPDEAKVNASERPACFQSLDWGAVRHHAECLATGVRLLRHGSVGGFTRGRLWGGQPCPDGLEGLA